MGAGEKNDGEVEEEERLINHYSSRFSASSDFGLSPLREKEIEISEAHRERLSRTMNRSRKRPLVYAIRDFPRGCGTRSIAAGFNLPQRSFKKPRTSDVIVKIPSVDHDLVAGCKPNRVFVKQEPAFRNNDHAVFAAHRPKGTYLKDIRKSNHGRVPKPEGAFLKQESVLRSSGHDATSREKVLEVLRIYKEVFKQLDRDKQARRGGDPFDGTARIDLKTQAIIEKMGKQVNTDKRIGPVPGINVGDVFQYKTELRVVGLHFKTMCGIDYTKIGDVKLATSIVASEGYGYNDRFDSDVVVYTGEGGNVISKENKTEDQKLVRGNLALANSMRKKSLVRVIRGEERWDLRGKRYVYVGLYSVDEYWLEKERGKTVYKFKLCRAPGQPLLT